MTQHDIYRDLKEALFKLIIQGADEETQIDLRIAMDKYFDEKIYPLGPEELEGYLATPQTLVRQFRAFLKDQG